MSLGAAAVEAEGELVEVGVEVLWLDGALVAAKQPALEQTCDAVGAGHRDVRGIAAVGHHDPFVGVAVIGQREIGAPFVGADPRPRLHSCLHEPDQARLRDIRDALQSDAPKALRVEHLDGDRDPRFRLGLPAPGPVLMPADVALVDFDAAGESFAIGADHRDAEAVQHHPCGLVAAKPQRALKPERAEPLLLAGHKPGRREPRTQRPLSSWFAAAWFVTSQKQGLSALGLQSALGLGSYQTAWMMLHRFRVAMVRPDRERLTGRVEVDESYVGGHEDWARGRQT